MSEVPLQREWLNLDHAEFKREEVPGTSIARLQGYLAQKKPIPRRTM